MTGEVATPYGGGLYQQYQNGDIFYSKATGAHDIFGPVASEFWKTGSEKDAFGTVVEKILELPTSDEPGKPGVAGPLTATFQGGVIDWSAATGAHVVYGAIGAKYNSLGGSTSFLGLPTTDEATTGSGNGRFNFFQNGIILWSPATGAARGARRDQC